MICTFFRVLFALIPIGTMLNLIGIMLDDIVPPHFLKLHPWNFVPRGFGAF